MTDVSILPTMDCEPPGAEISAHARRKSGTGPVDYGASERSIRGYVAACESFGFTPTLFVHPQVAARQRDLFLELEEAGVCLGLHLHPYKMAERYPEDLGAYPADEQREILAEAARRWEDAIGRHPRYVRPGVFSASDATFPVLSELGFRGGSVSSPGRVKPDAAAIWAGAPADPHRGHAGFRALAGDLDFVDVPVTVDRTRPVEGGHLGQGGYESLYVSDVEEESLDADPEPYDLEAVTRNALDRIADERPPFPAVVTNTHNNMDYADPDHGARENVETVLRTVRNHCESSPLTPRRETLREFVARFD